MDHEKLVLFQKIYDLILEVHPVIITFPKNQRFTLGQEMERSLILMLELIINVNIRKVPASYFTKLEVEIHKLRILIRLSKDYHFIKITTYVELQKKVVEIIKLLRSFQKTFNLLQRDKVAQ